MVCLVVQSSEPTGLSCDVKILELAAVNTVIDITNIGSPRIWYMFSLELRLSDRIRILS